MTTNNRSSVVSQCARAPRLGPSSDPSQPWNCFLGMLPISTSEFHRQHPEETKVSWAAPESNKGCANDDAVVPDGGCCRVMNAVSPVKSSNQNDEAAQHFHSHLQNLLQLEQMLLNLK